jgi:hypothetical protein
MSTPSDVRASLVDALRLDLVGPTGSLGTPNEMLPQAPSRWYLTRFLVPTEADEAQRVDPTSDDELDQAAEPAGLDDDETPERPAARRSYLPSSMGLSVLLPQGTKQLTATVRYGDYLRIEKEEVEDGPAEWRQIAREETLTLDLGETIPGSGKVAVPNGRGVELVWSRRGVPDTGLIGGLPQGTCCVSVFLVNTRAPSPDDVSDEGFVFQAEMELTSEQPFVARPNLRSLGSNDWDERVADLQYRDACEFAVDHSVSTTAIANDGECRTVKSCWIPDAEVERVAPAQIDGVELRMEELAKLTDGIAPATVRTTNDSPCSMNRSIAASRRVDSAVAVGERAAEDVPEVRVQPAHQHGAALLNQCLAVLVLPEPDAGRAARRPRLRIFRSC